MRREAGLGHQEVEAILTCPGRAGKLCNSRAMGKGQAAGMGRESSQKQNTRVLMDHCNDFDLQSERQEAPEGL